MKEDQVISEDQTIFAQFDKLITEGIEAQKTRSKTVSLDAFLEEKMRDFKSKKEEFEKFYCD